MRCRREPNTRTALATAASWRAFRSFKRLGDRRTIKFSVQSTYPVGGTLNTMWHADADFLSETYKGSDAYVTKDGLMYAQVTTFDGSKLKFKP